MKPQTNKFVCWGKRTMNLLPTVVIKRYNGKDDESYSQNTIRKKNMEEEK